MLLLNLQVWNQHFVMSGRDARYLRYNFGPYCKLEQVACGAPYYAECGIESTYNRSTSCNQRMCLRAVQSYLGACRITVELNPDASCTSTSTGMLWNHQVGALCCMPRRCSKHLIDLKAAAAAAVTFQ
jgi:hypothetical protein